MKGYYDQITGFTDAGVSLEDALKQEKPVLYDIKVLPGSMTPGYESWWRVGVAEVSTQPRVQAAYGDLM